MTVREHWDIWGIKWIAVQQSWVTKVSLATVLNLIWATVTDVWWVATVTITWWGWAASSIYIEPVTAWSATYTLLHTPVSATSFLVFSDSWIILFPTEDYTYSAGVITFLSLWANEKAYVYVLSTD